MPKTTTDLYRMGNVSSPRLTRVRIGKDIGIFQRNGVNWVAARSGGVSTFSARGLGANWWILRAGYDYPNELDVLNDHGNHYNWEPDLDMPLADFIQSPASRVG